ncbi:Zinc finger protein 518A [Triplophysa tibetana]|uniref:Zinc finger protein 518A n=1 Tax=Triplophysa tibetana TaxID=1572043 RepID=A0A5A9P9P8_9TELE|nr:Zinc finger protein 518A [Triplophysa tibetana]
MNVGSPKNEASGNWHKRLRLRKNSFTSSCEQNTVEQERKHGQTSTETSEKRAESLQNGQTVTDSVNERMLCCSACQDGRTFSRGELTQHYKIIHAGQAPVFPCDTCSFSTPVFSTLQHHRIMHKNCWFPCEAWDEQVQQTFPQLSQHCHEENISTVEIKKDAPDEEHKDLLGACRHRWSRRRKWWRKRDPAATPDDKPSHHLQFIHPESHWTSPLFPISAPGLLDNQEGLPDPKRTLQETQQFLEKWPLFLKTESDQTKPVPSGAKERRHPELISSLMEKNKMSVPPDCTTRVLGFKMVDGKKHLIIKVIPSNKRDASASRKSKGVKCQTTKDPTWLERDGWSTKHPSDRQLTSSRWKEISTLKTLYSPHEDKSQLNFIRSQRHSGCHGDVASGSAEERCHSQFVALVSQEEFQPSDLTEVPTDSCVHSSAGSPLKDSCQTESEVLFHSSAADDESTNNTNPRDLQIPVDECECEKRTHQLSRSLHTRLSSSSHHLITDAEGINQRRPPPVTETFQKQVLLNQESQKRWRPEERDIRWEAVPRDVPRSLRLRPHCSSQFISVPREKQPVVVLNHPDTDIPEVMGIMRVIQQHKGAVQRVVLSRKTLSTLADRERHVSRWPDEAVKERFSLKLRLKRVCGRKFTVVPPAPESLVPPPMFRCWFCGRLFQDQEVWVGHGQRHLTEATRGWNQLFNT